MIGREPKSDNDLFFTCSLIEYIARKTKNPSTLVVNTLGEDLILKIYDLADVYHSDNIERVSEDFILKSGLSQGEFDKVSACNYNIPGHFDIGKIYKRLILGLMREKNLDMISALFFAYNSPYTNKINDYNVGFYYDAPQNILLAFLGKDMIGRKVKVIVDRPLGTKHPKYPDTVYPVNYGYVKEFKGGDGEFQDAYVLGVEVPVEVFEGVVIAIIKRDDDAEEKWIVAPDFIFSKEEIEHAVDFTEKYYMSTVLM